MNRNDSEGPRHSHASKRPSETAFSLLTLLVALSSVCVIAACYLRPGPASRCGGVGLLGVLLLLAGWHRKTAAVKLLICTIAVSIIASEDRTPVMVIDGAKKLMMNLEVVDPDRQAAKNAPLRVYWSDSELQRTHDVAWDRERTESGWRFTYTIWVHVVGRGREPLSRRTAWGFPAGSAIRLTFGDACELLVMPADLFHIDTRGLPPSDLFASINASDYVAKCREGAAAAK